MIKIILLLLLSILSFLVGGWLGYIYGFQDGEIETLIRKKQRK